MHSSHYPRLVPLALLLAGAAGCTSAPEEKPAAPVAAAARPAPAVAAAPAAGCALPAYDFARLGQPRRLSTEAVRRLLARNPQLPRIFRDYNQYVDLVVLDTLRCAGYTLVPVLYRYEDCCEVLYYLTTPPDGAGVLDSVRVASRGLDGQWHAEARLQTTAGGALQVTRLEENDTDAANEPNLLDSVVTTFTVTPQGRFAQKRGVSAQRALRTGEHIPEAK